ncbi:MAG: sulfatase [Myxococcota bacterium]
MHTGSGIESRGEARLCAVGLATLAGLLEWCAASGPLPATVEAHARTLLAVVGIYATFGLACAVLSDGLGRPRGPGRGLAAGLAGGSIAVGVSHYGPGWILLPFAALAWVAVRAAVRVSERLPGLARARTWGALCGLGLAGALGLVAAAGHGGTRLAIAGAAVVVGLLAARGASRRRAGVPALAVALATLAVAGSWIPAEVPDAVAGAHAPAILLVTIDTCRVDRIGAYGYARAHTPNLDALARTGVRFQRAVTQSPWTTPSHVSILTGLLPTHHGVRVNSMRLARQVPTLVDPLRSSGYVTGAFVSGWPLEGERSGLRARFHRYDDDVRDFTAFPWHAYRLTLLRPLRRGLEWGGLRMKRPDRDATRVTDSAIQWLERNGGRPFFAWVHYYDPHLPYEPPPELLDREARDYRGPATGAWYTLDAAARAEVLNDPRAMAQMAALYDAEIAHVDRELGRLLTEARRAAPEGRLLVVVTADHGESFGEHGVVFARDVYEPTSRVPLIWAPLPAGPERVDPVEPTVRLVDLAPSILDWLGIAPEPQLDGRSFLPLLRGEAQDARPALTMMFKEAREDFPVSLAARASGWKLIHREPGWRGRERWGPRVLELYDLRHDPGEQDDRASREPERVEALDALLSPQLPRSRAPRLDLGPEELERLRSLGYMQ